MSVKCQRLINIIEAFAPKNLAAEWDNVGLQIGDPSREVKKVLVTLDVNDDVAMEAINGGFDLIVSHHPLIFKPIKNIKFDMPIGRIISLLMENKIMFYAAHTNLDCADRGVNAILAEKIGLVNPEVLAVGAMDELIKIVVFVPVGHEDKVREAMSNAGAGGIGKYSDCTFQSPGIGTFKALEGANPYLGRTGELTKADEIRIETIVPKSLAGKVVKAMLKNHPYEEVAYDLYPLLNRGREYGMGRIGYLKEPVSFRQLVENIKEILNIDFVRVGGLMNKEIKKLALCGGSGATFIHKASFAGADAYLTGDLKYHEAQELTALGLSFIDAGHYATEQVIVPVLAQYLQEKAHEQKLELTVMMSKVNTNPLLIL